MDIVKKLLEAKKMMEHKRITEQQLKEVTKSFGEKAVLSGHRLHRLVKEYAFRKKDFLEEYIKINLQSSDEYYEIDR